MVNNCCQMIEQFIDAHGNTQMAFLFRPKFVGSDHGLGDQIYEFEIVEKRKCRIPIEADSPEKAIDDFLEWYHSHTDGVEDLLEDGTDIRRVYFPMQTIAPEDYPADNLTFIREMEADHVIQNDGGMA